ncbi:uncharacterized protein K452DRAFT_321798 [Aplosporella prunicola CBS 121167]|uniref:Heterokaryon incompatibility domain-containing protein n=1 Tax=Aplosporella prunicola CBS 121167 TaxID=1176127 RepID=A0A6A6AZM4_9PEZI|nr:uncharacterized protein K452DRAFT_321798 [Aplosporella prunicola CBS 121167]KAF2137369.1 hypothetical protein K452DRAFT_321798 [Aplosporella prunicola CBS 121167]
MHCPMCKLILEAIPVPEGDEPFTLTLKWFKEIPFVLHISDSTRYYYLGVYTPEQNAISSHGVRVRLNQEPSIWTSKSHMIASTWIKQCIDLHHCGRQIYDTLPETGSASESVIPQILPARLIGLFQKGDDETSWDMRLVPVEEYVPYVALSYCWGHVGQPEYITTTENLQSRYSNIELPEEPPQTLIDAIYMVITLDMPDIVGFLAEKGVRYLWIDAICIVQDDPVDWQREAAKMGAIYSNASFTIAVDNNDPIEITTTLQDGQRYTLCFYKLLSVLPGTLWSPPTLDASTLSKRAWCFQERILSPRILHCTAEGLIWECREEYRFENNVASTLTDLNNVTLAGTIRILREGLPKKLWGLKVGEAKDPLLHPEYTRNTSYGNMPDQLNAVMVLRGGARSATAGSFGERRTGEQWEIVSWWNKNIVTPYSARHLTRFTDRLPALAGVARMFAEHINSPYIAGIWLAEIEDNLDWRRAGVPFHNEPLPFPSFSWIAHPGPVEWPCIGHMRPYGKSFELEVHAEKCEGIDEFDKIKSAHLELTGFADKGFCRFQSPPKGSPEYIHGELLDKDGTAVGEVEMDLQTYDEIWCFCMYENSIGFLRVLLLVEVGEEDANCVSRVGVGQIHPAHAEKWLAESTFVKVDLL